MSMKTGAAAIKAATSNDHSPFGGGHVDGGEGINILKALVYGKDGKRKTPVTKGEIKLAVDLFDRQPPKQRMGDLVTTGMPEHPGAVTFDDVASSAFKGFFANYGVQHPVVLKDQIKDALAEGRGTQLDERPDVAGMTYVFLGDRRRLDGDRREAYVDPASGSFYLKSTGAGMGGPHTVGPFWYGPIDLAPVEKQANVGTREKLMDIQKQISGAEWSAGARDLPMGPQFAVVPLGAENAMGGFQYTAYLPVSVVAPGAPQSDPNEAKYAFIMRHDGFAGMRSVVRVDLTEPAEQARPAA